MELEHVLEAILFSAQKPLNSSELREVLTKASEEPEAEDARAWRKLKQEQIEAALEGLARHHEEAARSYRLVCVAGAWQFVTLPEFAPWLRAFVGVRSRPPRLSQAGLETLAIVAYRQPLTKAEIEQIRGVSVDGVMQTLLERCLIEQVGRAEVVGRPMTYGTTSQFLEYFGLRSLDELPAADELRRIPVTKPPTLATAEPGLATVPPEQIALADVDQEAAGAALVSVPKDSQADVASAARASSDASETPPEQA